MKKSGIIVLLLIGFLVCPLGEDLPGLAPLLQAAIENNPDLKRQVLAVESAREAMPDFWKLADSRISIGGSYKPSSGGGTPDSEPFSGNLGVTIPLISQLEIGASIDDEGRGNLSLALNPFTFDTNRYKAEESYAKALNQLTLRERELVTSLEEAVLNWNSGIMNLDYLKAVLQWQEDNLAIVEKQYDLGKVTLTAWDAAKESYLNARQKYYDGENATLRNRQTLSVILGPGNENLPVPEITIANLLDFINRQAAALEALEPGDASSQQLINLELELTTLTQQLKAMFPVQPSFSLSADLGFPDLDFSGKASLSLSGNQLKFSERQKLQNEVELKKADILTERYRLSLDVQMLRQSIRIAGEVLQLNQNDLAATRTLLEELKFLYARGERTSLEVQQGELNLVSATLRVYQGALSMYKAQQDYLAMFQN